MDLIEREMWSYLRLRALATAKVTDVKSRNRVEGVANKLKL